MFVLIVGHAAQEDAQLEEALADFGLDWQVAWAEDAVTALALAMERPVDVVAADLQAPSFDGPSLLAQVRTHHPQAARILLLEEGSDPAALSALESAHRFLNRPLRADELVEAAKIDGAGPLRFFKDIVLPLSVTNIAALFVIMFIYGWNQYLWPLLITTDPDYYTIVMGLQRMTTAADGDPQWHLVMAAVVMAALPPVLVILFMQRLFVKGLTETEK